MTAAEATQVASTVFAAVAAVGAGTAAWVMYRQWSASRKPAVSIDVSEFNTGAMFLTLVNYGGAAKKVSFVVIEGKQACMGFLPMHGYLAPGERARLRLACETTGERKQIAAAYGFDLDGRWVYAWAANGQNLRWRARPGRWRRRVTDETEASIVQRFYPGAPDPDELDVSGFTLMPPEGEAFPPTSLR